MQRSYRAFGFHSSLDTHQNRMPTSVCIKNFFAGERQFHRAPSEHRQFANYYFMLKRISFSAKPTADRSGNYPNLTGRHFEDFNQCSVDIMRSLRRRPKGEPLIGSLFCDRRMLLHRQMRTALVIKKLLPNMIGLSKSGFRITKF